MVHREPLLWKLGLQRLDKNIDLLSPGFLIKPEVCLTIQVNNNGSQLKHPNCTGLEYARDFGNSMKESLKQGTKWSAFYFTHPNSYYLLPQTNVPLRNIPMMKRLPVRAMSKEVQDLMHHWASKHRKAVRQLTIHQTTHSIQ